MFGEEVFTYLRSSPIVHDEYVPGELAERTGATVMAKRKATIQLKRAYEAAAKDDGTRILVERLWPRGVSKEKAAIDLWVKELAPSAELRKWYAHDQTRWAEFRTRYLSELEQKGDALRDLERQIEEGPVTFVY
ncbi:MAG TPA: DUF488 family protein, partial [Isosphaeraceae bacterium]|nr:DUF488 family protein [Isosphaeraceae bacterium]